MIIAVSLYKSDLSFLRERSISISRLSRRLLDEYIKGELKLQPTASEETLTKTTILLGKKQVEFCKENDIVISRLIRNLVHAYVAGQQR